MSYPYPSNSERLAPEELSKSVETPLEPINIGEDEPREARIINHSWFQFSDHHGFERRLNLRGSVNAFSVVMVSISEIGWFGDRWKPFMGAASCEVHNVVPHDDGIVIVRGSIGHDRDINVRLSVLVF